MAGLAWEDCGGGEGAKGGGVVGGLCGCGCGGFVQGDCSQRWCCGFGKVQLVTQKPHVIK